MSSNGILQGYDEERRQIGKQLINQLAILMKTAQIHDPGNIALQQPTENFCKILGDLFLDDPEVVLSLEGDSLYLGEMKLKLDIDIFTNFMWVSTEMRKRKIGSIVFSRGIREGEVRQFCFLFGSLDPRLSNPFEGLRRGMERASLTNPQIEELEERKEKEEVASSPEDNKEMPKQSYFNAVTAVSEVMESLKLRQAISLKRGKRVVQSMVDLIFQEDSTLLGLTTLRTHDEYTYNHSVNVCILALAIGQRLGYNKQRLCELGMAGLFHDLGKYGIPLDVLNKPSDFTEEEWKIMRRHPIFSVKELVRLKGVNDMAIRVMIGAFEHHLNYDLSGYPKLATKRNLSLIGRIICIVDCYDALTSARVYNRNPFSPDKALRFMLSRTGKAFDPILMKLFINAIGVFPIGTVVLLNTKEVCVVCASNPNPERGDRPKIKRILDASGNETAGEVIDLCEVDEQGHFKYEIEKVIDATQYKVDVAKYFA